MDVCNFADTSSLMRALCRPEEPPQLPLFPGARLGRFEIVGEIGRGGYGAVFEAVDPTLGRPVALKVVRPGRRSATADEWLTREAQHAARLSHPHIVQVHELGSSEYGPYLVMELLRGATLRQVLSQRRLDRREALDFAAALLAAVAHAHAQGVVHRDLKPENVFVAGGGQIKVLDFGLSPLVSPGAAGTPGYMAPEQARGEASDERADVFALGAILFEMWTGRRPFDVRGDVTIYRPLGLAGLPRAVAALCSAMLDPDPSLRPLHAGLAAAAFSQARDALAATSAPRTVRRRLGIALLCPRPDGPGAAGPAGSFGGRLTSHAPEYAELVFDPTEVDHPLRAALRFSRAVTARGAAIRALVDLEAVTVLSAGAEQPRYLGRGPRRLPDLVHLEPGVYVTSAAAGVLCLHDLRPAGVAGWLQVPPPIHATAGGLIADAAAPFTGRREPLSRLLALARDAHRTAVPAVAAVTGATGLGCSRLEAEMAAALVAGPECPSILRLGADDHERPSESLARVLGAATGLSPACDGGRMDPEALTGLGLGGNIALGAALGLGWLTSSSAELSAKAVAQGALHTLLVRGAGVALRRAAESRPLAILVDDAQQAGDLLLDVLEHAALAEGGARIFVCAFGRPELLDRRPTFGSRAARRATMRLEPLSTAEAAELCRALLQPARNVTAQALQVLTERAAGVPRLLVDLVSGLRRDGLVHHDPATGAWTLRTDRIDRMPDLPPLEWLADRELDRLPPELTPTAQLMALLGDGTGPGELAGVAAELQEAGIAIGAGDALQRSLQELVHEGLVREEGGRFRFSLPLLREAVARAVPEGLRHAARAAACRYYATSATLDEGTRLTRLARHASAVGQHETAGMAQLALADGLRAGPQRAAAEAAYTRALEHLPEARKTERLRARWGRGALRFQCGREQEAVADLLEAASVAQDLGDGDAEAQCLLDAATACDWLTDFGRSAELLARARHLVPDPSPQLRARLDLAEGRALFRASRWAEACLRLESAADRAAALGQEGHETRMGALLLLGTALPVLGRVAEAERALERARVAAKACGDLAHLAASLINGRNLLIGRGDLGRALGEQEEAVALSREAGIVGTEYNGRYNLAELHYQAGNVEGAVPQLVRTAQIEEEHPDLAAIPFAQLLWARLELMRGDVEAARHRLACFWEGLRRGQRLTWRRATLNPADVILADMVDLATRNASEAEWEDLVERSRRGSIEQEPIEVLEMRARAAVRRGNRSAARAALDEARRLADVLPNLFGARLDALRAALDA